MEQALDMWRRLAHLWWGYPPKETTLFRYALFLHFEEEYPLGGGAVRVELIGEPDEVSDCSEFDLFDLALAEHLAAG